MRTTMIKTLMVVLILGLLTAIGSAATVTSATKGGITANDTLGTGTGDTIPAVGGQISTFDISKNEQSQNWVGFFGSVTKSIVLNGASDAFYSWGSTASTTGTVLFVNTTSVNWGAALTATVAGDAANEDTTLGFGAQTDNVSNTFTNTNAQAFDLGATSIAAHDALSTNTTSSGGASWETVMLYQGANYIYAGVMDQNNNNYAGDPVDFQVMVPVNTGTNTRTYYLYAALD